MPFYEYECTSCKFYVEVMQKISDAPLRKCPSCSRNTLKKLVSAPVFRLKGAGWYETDFKSDKDRQRNLAKEEQAPESKADASKEEGGKAAAGKEAEPKATAAPAPESKPAAASRRRPEGGAKSTTRTATRAKPTRVRKSARASRRGR